MYRYKCKIGVNKKPRETCRYSYKPYDVRCFVDRW